MTIENQFDVEFVAAMALREKQIQQNYRPIIAVHKWFARRPGTLFRSLVLSEFSKEPLASIFFRANDFPERAVADPFMGGGTPLIEANRVGCDVLGFDINPMAAWVVREEIEHIELDAYQAASSCLLKGLRTEVGEYYLTDCSIYGDKNVPAKYFLWVKEIDCTACERPFDLFPGYLLSEDARHPKNVLVCFSCGELNEVQSLHDAGSCRECKSTLRIDGPAKRRRCLCPHCGHENVYPRPEAGPPRHRMFAIEYYNPARKEKHKGRFFKKPDAKDLARYREAQTHWARSKSRFVPEQPILAGDETDRLHRWGYQFYRDLFNTRQLLGLELSAQRISKIETERIRHALATNLSDLLRYQNMLCRYDTMALKSLDVFSVHGFPVGLVQCESNLIGITNGLNTNVGSGGWTNIIEKYTKAKQYCDRPFEVKVRGSRKTQVAIPGEWIGERLNGFRERKVTLRCESSTEANLPETSLDAVFTDPPYFGNVQYGELMDFCYVWLRRLVGNESEGFWRDSTRTVEELTGNETQGRGLAQLHPGARGSLHEHGPCSKTRGTLVFTYHHNKLEAYQAIAVAILDAGLTCSASLPCPAEMGGSIHIHGTGSSIVDTVFVCREKGDTMRKWLFSGSDELTSIVSDNLESLRAAGLKGTRGDVRCIVFGHIARMAVWNLKATWDKSKPTLEKLALVAAEMGKLGDSNRVIEEVSMAPPRDWPPGSLFATAGVSVRDRDAVSF